MNKSQLNRIHDVEIEILDEIVRICEKYHLRYCLVGKDKVPYTIDGKNAKPNNESDFVSFNEFIHFAVFNKASCVKSATSCLFSAR